MSKTYIPTEDEIAQEVDRLCLEAKQKHGHKAGFKTVFEYERLRARADAILNLLRQRQEMEAFVIPDVAATQNGERDPKGLDPKTPGAKLDHGKMKAHLLQDFSRALWAVGEVGTFGAAKYSEGGWQHADNGVERYHAAFLRHWMKAGYEDLDPDSGLMHLAHSAWNLLAALELSLRECEKS